jgi:HAMP domain-containing protein
MSGRRVVALVAAVLMAGALAWGLVPFRSHGLECRGALTWLATGHDEYPEFATIKERVDWTYQHQRQAYDIDAQTICYDDGRPRAITVLILLAVVLVVAVGATALIGKPKPARQQTTQSVANGMTTKERLVALGELRSDGLISAEEHDRKRQELLEEL